MALAVVAVSNLQTSNFFHCCRSEGEPGNEATLPQHSEMPVVSIWVCSIPIII